MKKKNLILATIFIAMCNLFCTEFNIAINPGEQWKKRAPQIALWIEDENGQYITTFFVTKGASKNSWKFSPKDGRPDSLPVWYNASKTDPSNADKTQTKSVDAVTSATPKNAIVVNTNINLEKNKKYFIKAEINQSFDYTEKYTKKNSGVNGQPSAIYQKEFIYTNTTSEITLDFLGTGSIDGSDGEIHFTENQNLTTAKKILDSIYVTIK